MIVISIAIIVLLVAALIYANKSSRTWKAIAMKADEHLINAQTEWSASLTEARTKQRELMIELKKLQHELQHSFRGRCHRCGVFISRDEHSKHPDHCELCFLKTEVSHD